jgi:hypothetical protein
VYDNGMSLIKNVLRLYVLYSETVWQQNFYTHKLKTLKLASWLLFRGSHNGVAKDAGFVGCDALSSGK